MRSDLFTRLAPVFCLLMAVSAAQADIIIRADKPGREVSPTLYGAFFEDINRAGDGGVYAEMLQNRSFEDASVPIGWSLIQAEGGKATMAVVKDDPPINLRNLTHLKLEMTSPGTVGIYNEGFKGTSLTGNTSSLPSLDVTATSASSPGTGAGGSTSAPSGRFSSVLPAFFCAQVSLSRTVKP